MDTGTALSSNAVQIMHQNRCVTYLFFDSIFHPHTTPTAIKCNVGCSIQLAHSSWTAP